MTHPQAVEPIFNHCQERMAKFREDNQSGRIEIICYRHRGQYKIDLCCGYVLEFLILQQELAGWRLNPLSRERQPLENVEDVLEMLASALFETFYLEQCHAIIVLSYRRNDRQYGFQFSPSIHHGKSC